MKSLNKDRLIMQEDTNTFNVVETFGHMDIEQWYLKNRLLYSNFPDIEEYELKDEYIYEKKPKVGRQYLKSNRSYFSYALYLGYKWFLLSKEPITEEYLRSDASFRIAQYNSITKKFVEGFQIKISDFPKVTEQLKQVKEKQKWAMEL